MKTKNLFKVLVLAAGMCLPAITNAQVDPPADPNDNVPIDGGLSILLAAGIGYGVKKAYSSHKKKTSEGVAEDVSSK